MSRSSRKRREANRSHGKRRGPKRTRAQEVLPGTYMLTRRCIDRKMLMLADDVDGETVNQHIKFALATAAEIAGVELHAWEVMSNHLHVLFSDLKPNANFPAFAQALDSAIARNVNAIRGRFGTFWEGEGPLFTALPTGEDVMRDMVYTVTNSSDAGLVKWGDRWPGVHSYGLRFGTREVIKRPTGGIYGPNSTAPESVELVLTRPPIFPELSDDELFARMMARARERERQAHARMRKSRRRIMGEKQVRKQNWRKVGVKPEDRFEVKPRVSSSSTRARIGRLRSRREFQDRYIAARDAFADGRRDVEFPYGTFQMRQHKVNITACPPQTRATIRAMRDCLRPPP